MAGHYKDVGEIYAYQRPLMKRGFYLQDVFWPFGSPGPGDHHSGPLDFDENFDPEFENSNKTPWDFRRILKKFVEAHKNDHYKDKDVEIVKAVGYWKDLHPFVYEIWVRNHICLKCKKQNNYYCARFERELCFVQYHICHCK